MPAALFLIAMVQIVGLGLGDDPEPAVSLPPPAKRQVDFHKEILPILSRRCAECHVGERPKGNFRIETRELLLAGGDSGPSVVTGESARSLLIELVAGIDPDRVMPASGKRLSEQEVGLLRAWIDQGVKWEQGVRLSRPVKTAPLEPRRPKLPPVAESTNPIDALLIAYARERKTVLGEVVPDRLFARRVHLDIIGLLPATDELDRLEHDTRPDKRERLVQTLLEDRMAYAEHWLTFWNDALRNGYRGTGYIDDGRSQITGWLFKALYDNLPYDEFVRQLIHPVPGSEGFVYGIKWRGVVNASQRREMQAAQTIAQVFMGTNLKCASCHDSFVNHWKLTDAYGLANVFADEPLEIHRCDKPTGAKASTAFLYPQLGSIEGSASKDARLKQLADLTTNGRNGRLARTIVNRLWAVFLGRGLVEPVDDMDQDPWNRDLLDWLAADLQDHGYDLKHTIRLICTSKAYQSASVGAPRPEEKSFVFRGPFVRRMSAEQFVDALSQVTDVWEPITPEMKSLDGRKQGGQLAAVLSVISDSRAGAADREVTWIWSHPDAARSDPGGRIYFRKVFDLPAKPSRATAAVTCDNEFVLYVNGQRAAASNDWQSPTQVDLAPWLVRGSNTLAVEAINWPDPETGKGALFQGGNPAGFVFLAVAWDGAREVASIASDVTWVWTRRAPSGWEKPGFDTKRWLPAVALADADRTVWRRGGRLHALARPGEGENPSRVRSALADTDSLTRALGRPDREQVVTRRESVATTLQALELTNGGALAKRLALGAANWLKRPSASSSQRLVDEIYLTSLGRRPTTEEARLACDLVGSPPTAPGVEDLLWILAMLPEFQLID